MPIARLELKVALVCVAILARAARRVRSIIRLKAQFRQFKVSGLLPSTLSRRG